MYQALYRKYRPSTFDDVCGHSHITKVLKTQVLDNKTSHAYLFCGSRGTGKTSCAKILAKAVNCLEPINGSPCNKCEHCLGIDNGSILDVVEMDAASNNGVDNIRKICEDVMYLPAEVKKRVYIIDEVHMLSIGAFNALLKTLEEPPEYVIFILATTDINKVPATIVSRCQRFDFRRIPSEVIIERLMYVAGREGLDLDRNAAAIIAKICDGGMRDALSLLEACTMTTGTITAEVVTNVLGLSDRELILDLIEALVKKNCARTLHLVNDLHSKSGDFKEVIADILKYYKDILVLKFIPTPDSFTEYYQSEAERLSEIAGGLTKEEILYHIEVFEDLFASYDKITVGKKVTVEIAFLKLCLVELGESPAALLLRVSELEKKIAMGVVAKAPEEQTSSKPKQKANELSAKSEPDEKKASSDTVDENVLAAQSAAKVDYIPQLIMRMQEESLIKPYLRMVSFKKSGDTLYVVATGFIKGVLESTNCASVVKAHVTELDKEIKNVVITESAPDKNTSSGSDLDDF